jgi:hypothetical protein
MEIEMRVDAPVPGADPKAGARYLVDGAEVSEAHFALAVQRRHEAPYRDASWLFNGQPMDPETFAQWRGLP